MAMGTEDPLDARGERPDLSTFRTAAANASNVLHYGAKSTTKEEAQGMQGVAEDLRTLAFDLKNFLVKYHRVTDINGPEPASSDWRHWEISFVHRGIRRHYYYHIQRVDPSATMYQAIRADTNGELLVRIPNAEQDALLENTIYYPPHG